MILKVIVLYCLLCSLLYFSVACWMSANLETIQKNGWANYRAFKSIKNLILDLLTTMVPVKGLYELTLVLLVINFEINHKKEDVRGVISIDVPFTNKTIVIKGK